MSIVVLTIKDSSYEVIDYKGKVSGEIVAGLQKEVFTQKDVVAVGLSNHPIIGNYHIQHQINETEEHKTCLSFLYAKRDINDINQYSMTYHFYQKSQWESNVWYHYRLRKLSGEMHEGLKKEYENMNIFNEDVKSKMSDRGFYFYSSIKDERGDSCYQFLRRENFGPERIMAFIPLSGENKGKLQLSYEVPVPVTSQKNSLINTLKSSFLDSFTNEVGYFEVYQNFIRQVEVLHNFINEK